MRRSKYGRRYNWHKKKHQARTKELVKRAPKFLFRRDKNITYHNIVDLNNINIIVYPSVKKLFKEKYFDRINLMSEYFYETDVYIQETSKYITLTTDKVLLYKQEVFKNLISFIEWLESPLVKNIFKDFNGYLDNEIIRAITISKEQSTAKYKVSSSKHAKIRNKLLKEKHWYSGMICESNGRTKTKKLLKEAKNEINEALGLNNNSGLHKVGDVLFNCEEITEIFYCNCEDCFYLDYPVCDVNWNIVYDSYEHLEKFEKLSELAKDNHERWIYEY